jgi:predicted metal-dependent peptidase
MVRAHRDLMRYKETAPMAGIILMGETRVLTDEEYPKGLPLTAYTDGKNKYYAASFLVQLTQQQVAGLVLHETYHIGYKHLLRNRRYWEEDANAANIAADHVVNASIAVLDQNIVALPPGAHYDPKYIGWSFGRVYQDVKQQQDKADGQGNNTGTLDSHHMFGVLNESEESADEAKQLEQQVDAALREGKLLAGRMKVSMPRAVEAALEPEVDWVSETNEFVTTSMSGREERSWRQYDRRRLVHGLYCPTSVTETLNELAVLIDVSGSTHTPGVFGRFVGELVSICQTLKPTTLRVIYWDTEVQAEQVLTESDYDKIETTIRPVGGGGTRVGCINDYLERSGLLSKPDCAVVFTDGYVEDSFEWRMPCPTLWLVTHRDDFRPPVGKVLKVN